MSDFLDQGVAEDSGVIGLVSELQERIRRGEKIYIHCWGGHGRTGTIVAILLGTRSGPIHSEAKMYDLDSVKALEFTAKFHKCRIVAKSRSPQHPSQFAQVRRIVDGEK